MSHSSVIPVICCGAREEMGRRVIEGLKPEIEVVQFVRAGEGMRVLIPPVLAGKTPPPHPESSTIGTGNYADVPQAVVLGGAFTEGAVVELRQTVGVTKGARKVPWVIQDKTKGIPVTAPGFLESVVKRQKEALARLKEEGKLDGTHDGIELW